MKKLTSTGRRLLTALLLLAGASAVSATAQLPEVRMYYPGESTPPAELKQEAKAYIYFVNGSKVRSCRANVLQGGQNLGSITYRVNPPTGNPAATLTMYPTDEENAFLNKIPQGEFTLEFVEINYVDATGADVHWADEANPFGRVTYLRKGENGTIVSETGFDHNTVRSYYAPEDIEGIKTFTFSKAVDGSVLKPYFSYGNGVVPNITYLPYTLSDDGLTLTIDIRGRCYNPDVLAPGVTFVDQDGNPIDPPKSIVLAIDHLNCLDGTQITTVSYSPDHTQSTKLNGRLHLAYNYDDITFATPVLKEVKFYSSTAPVEQFPGITSETDMMRILVENASVIEKADIRLDYENVSATIPNGQYAVQGGKYFEAAIPAEIREKGSDRLIISLENVEYNLVDGATHVVRPLNLAYLGRSVTTIAELRTLDTGTYASLIVPKGIKISLSNDNGYTFAEDETAGIQLSSNTYVRIFDEFTLVRGTLAGIYKGGGLFEVDPEASDYTQAFADMTVGPIVKTVDELKSGAYDYRLVTLVASKAMPISVDAYGQIVVASTIPVLSDMVEDYVAPERVANVTGVFYNDPIVGSYILLRKMSDINNDDVSTEQPAAYTVAEIKTLEPNNNISIEVEDLLVTFALDAMSVSFVEDATGALQVVPFDEEGVAPFVAGNIISGTLYGYYMGNSILAVDPERSTIKTRAGYIAEGTTIKVVDASKPENFYRLLTFKASDDVTMTTDEDLVLIGDNIVYADILGILPDTFTWPSRCAKLTGILFPSEIAEDDNQSGTPELYMFPRSKADIVAEPPSGVESIETTAEPACAVYDLCGRLVRKPGEGTAGLRPGLYIQGPTKLLVK